MSKLKIYVAGSMSGLSWKEIKRRFYMVRDRLQGSGFMVFTPLLGKDGTFDDNQVLNQRGYDGNPLTKESSIVLRDNWMVRQADIIFANLSGVTRISIGTMFEIAWAYMLGKYVVVVMEEDNPHRHAFIEECATIFKNEEDALCYLESFEEIMK